MSSTLATQCVTFCMMVLVILADSPVHLVFGTRQSQKPQSCLLVWVFCLDGGDKVIAFGWYTLTGTSQVEPSRADSLSPALGWTSSFLRASCTDAFLNVLNARTKRCLVLGFRLVGAKYQELRTFSFVNFASIWWPTFTLFVRQTTFPPFSNQITLIEAFI